MKCLFLFSLLVLSVYCDAAEDCAPGEPQSGKEPAPGWVGGFKDINPDFEHCDLSALPALDNMDNIDLLQRQQGVKWPEFSWLTDGPGGSEDSRCFQKFAPYISRLGYTNTGRVYSIICPQQGIHIPHVGMLNVEVTVNKQKGWVDETPLEGFPQVQGQVCGDLSVTGKVWFGPSLADGANNHGESILKFLTTTRHPYPTSKNNAIQVTTHLRNNPRQPLFPLVSGECTDFKAPEFARHFDDGAWSVANLEVEIGPIKKVHHEHVDKFNQLVMDLFNTGSGNMLKSGNVLTWNVWFVAPDVVDKEEWRTHAVRWRHSIDEEHPISEGTQARFFDGRNFSIPEHLFEEGIKDLLHHIHL